jgi:phospholipid transport system substrate-binding protein
MLTRVKTIILVAIICTAGISLPQAYAQAKPSGSQAQTFIDTMGKEAVGFLSDESLSQSQKQQQFRTLLTRNFDINTIARFALGRYWNTASEAQKKEYLKLFENMIVRVYSGRFDEYNGQKFNVSSASSTGKNDMLVTSYIVPPSGSKVQVDWRVRERNGSLKVVDVIIEGVSMSLTQRSDFASVIQRGGGDIDALLKHLRK